MKTLAIDTIAQKAKAQLTIAEKVKELDELLSVEYPGFKVKLVMEEEVPEQWEEDKPQRRTPPPRDRYDSALAAAKGILSESHIPLLKGDLLGRINGAGFDIGMETLSGYLSKDEEFVRDENHRGVWGLKKHFETKPQ